MKNLTQTLGILAVAAILWSADAASYRIGLSPNCAQPDARIQESAVLLFILETASPGDDVAVYDALAQQPVTRFTIPAGAVFEHNAAARARRLVDQLRALNAFFSAERQFTPGTAAALNVPAFLDFAGTQLRSPGERIRVILLGSPLWNNPAQPRWSMNSAVPSDGAILADGSQSPFGTAGNHGALANLAVHWAYLGNPFKSDFHRERTERFWALWCQQQGAVLATFAPDINLAFERAQNIQEPCIAARLDENDKRVEMRSVLARPVPTLVEHELRAPPPPQIVIQTNVVNQVVTITNRVVEHQVVTETNWVQAAKRETPPGGMNVPQDAVGIGIQWLESVDLDLYVKPSPTSQELSPHRRVTSEGTYVHDIKSRNDFLDYEYVKLTAPVEFSRLEAWVNWCSGKAPSVHGTVVVFFNGRARYGKFTLLHSEHGNYGWNSKHRDSSPYWLKLDLQKIVGQGEQANVERGPH